MRVGGEGEATPRGGLLAGHRQGREVPEGRTQHPQHPQRDTASWTQARKGSPREAYPIEHSTPSGYCYLDASKDGKAFEGCIPASTTPPPAGYYELDAGKDGKASEERIPAGAPRCTFSGACVRSSEWGSACALYNKVTELQKMQPRRSKGG